MARRGKSTASRPAAFRTAPLGDGGGGDGGDEGGRGGAGGTACDVTTSTQVIVVLMGTSESDPTNTTKLLPAPEDQELCAMTFLSEPLKGTLTVLR